MKKLNLGHRLAFSGAIMFAALLFAISFFAGPSAAQAQAPVSIDWESANGVALLKGEQVTTQYAGALPVGFTVSADNNVASHPDVALIFDSNTPGTNATGDPDLGTPNNTCVGGGPGVGIGGQVNTPGENCIAEGNLLIIAENIVDANSDGYVDNPDDEALGGTITIVFDIPVNVLSTVILDQEDADSVTINALDAQGVLLTSANPIGQGDNSREDIPVGAIGVTTLEFVFSNSGGIATIVVEPPGQTAINLGAFNTASDAPYVGLWIAAAAALLSTATIIVRRRSLLNMNHS